MKAAGAGWPLLRILSGGYERLSLRSVPAPLTQPGAPRHHASLTPSLPRPAENKGAFLQRHGAGGKKKNSVSAASLQQNKLSRLQGAGPQLSRLNCRAAPAAPPRALPAGVKCSPLSWAPRAESGHCSAPLSPFPAKTWPPLTSPSGPSPTRHTYNPRQGLPLHHVHKLEGDLLPAATLSLLGAGAQVGAADDILMVHQGPVPGWFLTRKRHLWVGCYGLPQKLEGERAGAMPTPTSVLPGGQWTQ